MGARLIATGVVLLFAAPIGCEIAGDEATGSLSEPLCTNDEAIDVYQRYLAPVMDDPASQSCNGCHTGDINLSMYAQETVCRTMLCMVERQMIDTGSPDESRLLEFIDMAKPETGFDIQVEREYDGVLAWAQYTSTCQLEACGEIEDPCGDTVPAPTTGPGGSGGAGGSGAGGSGGSGGSGGGPVGPQIGNCNESDVLAAFDANVYGILSMGCAACHSPLGEDADKDDPGWWVDESSSLATLYNVIGESGMLDVAFPNQSELITKPLPDDESVASKLGIFVGVEHAGGPKLTPGTENFQPRFDAFVDFIEYYASCFTG